MKKSLTYACQALVAGAMICLPFSTLVAAETNGAPLIAGTPLADNSTGVVKLPYGVEEVLKLSRANISDDITINYIQSSGTIYNLTAQDIVYLRNQGVSDR